MHRVIRMFEYIFKDMDYVRVFDWITDMHKTFDAEDVAKNTFVPSGKAWEVLKDFERLGLVKQKESKTQKDWSINPDSKVFELLVKADMACSSIFAREGD